MFIIHIPNEIHEIKMKFGTLENCIEEIDR